MTSFTSPIRHRYFLVMLGLIQIVKLLVIVSQPDTSVFLSWFYGWSHQAPYSNVGNWGIVPYSLLWYGLNWPTFWGYWAFNFYILTIDTLVIGLLAWKHSQFYVWFYVQASFFFLLNAQADFFTSLILFAGRYRVLLLPLALAMKFPLIPPILDARLWTFIGYVAAGHADGFTWSRYFYLGSILASSFYFWTLKNHPLILDRLLRLIGLNLCKVQY